MSDDDGAERLQHGFSRLRLLLRGRERLPRSAR